VYKKIIIVPDIPKTRAVAFGEKMLCRKSLFGTAIACIELCEARVVPPKKTAFAKIAIFAKA